MPPSADREELDRRLDEQEKRLDKIAANYERLSEELTQLETNLSASPEIQADNQRLTQQKPK